MSILFSQVREDPKVELYIDSLMLNKKRYLIVGSGGCTLFSLLSVLNEESEVIIDVIDQNINQLFLIKLKLAVIMYCDRKVNAVDSILDFFEGKLSRMEYDDILSKFRFTDEEREFWRINKNLIYSGINQSGTFEKLFKDLVNSRYDFEKVFDKKNLIEKFGESAVINSLNKEFYDHFRNIMDKYHEKYKIDENYFFYQIIYNRYNRKCLPPYFNNLKKVIENRDKINFICGNFFDYIQKTDNKYNLIHTSNLTDWVDKNELIPFFNRIKNLLLGEGYVISRRLNGDYNLKETILENKFEILDNILDISEFYSEVVVGKLL
jgi:S-adenosylmethionine:diacylglycerol 3-amino-3-carboxypropyl transferase